MAHVGNDFISVMEVPMIAGRAFTPQDTESSPKVAIINQALAQILSQPEPGRQTFYPGTSNVQTFVGTDCWCMRRHSLQQHARQSRSIAAGLVSPGTSG